MRHKHGKWQKCLYTTHTIWIFLFARKGEQKKNAMKRLNRKYKSRYKIREVEQEIERDEEAAGR